MQVNELDDAIQRAATAELARRYFYDYCVTLHPNQYTADRVYLKDVAERMQAFFEQNHKRFLVVNMPPRHLKSFTATNLAEWLLGKWPEKPMMTASYNETLSTTFARKVRDTIDTTPVRGGKIVYRNIFPATRLKYGQSSASLWALEGSTRDTYLATSPTGTATGFGATTLIIDDIIKNAEEAYNDVVLNKIWDWFVNTMMSRLEGDDYKVVVVMTRWATQDLAGRIIDNYGDLVEHITYKALQDDGTMLAESILSKGDYELKTQEMNQDIVEANYNQVPIDVKGKLYGDFKEYVKLPEPDKEHRIVKNYTDTADTGKDPLCSVNYEEHNGDIYITDVVLDDSPAEVTEPKVAALLTDGGVTEATFESNNGGRLYARNIERLIVELGNKKTVVKWKAQTHNKEARILASSAWVNQHVFMPPNWKNKWPEFYRQLSKYQMKGKNDHDDAPDVLAAIYEASTRQKTQWAAPIF
jgi:predicted phage terminase large subunit-like protein